MKVDVYLNSQQPISADPGRCLAATIEQVRLIRSLGFDSIWVGEHHTTPGYQFYPQFSLLHRLAPEADGMWLGTNVTLLPLHHPIEVAVVGAFLDGVTGSRFTLGAALGYREEEFAAFGVPFRERGSRLSEAVQIVRRLCAEDRVTHHGRHWDLDGVRIGPKPVQAPSPPILLGGQAPAALHRAAELGDGWLGLPTATMSYVEEQLSVIRRVRRDRGSTTPPELVRLVEARPRRMKRSASPRRTCCRSTPRISRGAWTGSSSITRRNRLSLRRLAADRFAIGSPSEVVQMLMRYHAAGVHAPLVARELAGHGPGRHPHEHPAVGAEVLPEVRRRIARPEE